MTPLFPTRRAAEDFDSVLSGTASTAVTDRVLERHADLVSTVATLRAVPQVLPSADFVTDLRTRLLLAAETELVAALPVLRTARPQSTRSRRAGTVAAALVIVGGTAGMATAANGALPGESLYPIKRGGEQLSEAVRLSDAGKGRALLGQAETRLVEVRDLMAGGSADPDLVASTLDSFRGAADQGSEKLFASYQRDGDSADISEVRGFAAEQMTTLSAMAQGADTPTAASLRDAADTLAEIDQEARALCAGCSAQTGLETPPSLAEGAAAVSMANLLARPSDQAGADITAERLAALLREAQRTADKTPLAPSAAAASTPGVPTAQAPVTSTVSGAGELLPGSGVSGKAVDDLVSGVTHTLGGVSVTVSSAGDSLSQTAGQATKGATDAAKGATDATTGAVQGATGGQVP